MGLVLTRDLVETWVINIFSTEFDDGHFGNSCTMIDLYEANEQRSIFL